MHIVKLNYHEIKFISGSAIRKAAKSDLQSITPKNNIEKSSGISLGRISLNIISIAIGTAAWLTMINEKINKLSNPYKDIAIAAPTLFVASAAADLYSNILNEFFTSNKP